MWDNTFKLHFMEKRKKKNQKKPLLEQFTFETLRSIWRKGGDNFINPKKNKLVSGTRISRHEFPGDFKRLWRVGKS